MRYPPDAAVHLHSLYHRREGNGYLIGDPETGEFTTVTPAELRVVDLLRKGLSISQVQELVKDEEDRADVHAVLEELRDHGFIHKIGKRLVTPLHEPLHEIRIRAAWLGGKSARFLYLLISLFGLFTLAWRGSVPSFLDLFVSDSLTITLLCALAVAWLFIFVRQLAKHGAAQSRGLESRFGLANTFHIFAPKAHPSGASSEERHYVLSVGLLSLTAITSLALLLTTYGPVGQRGFWELAFAVGFVEILAECLLFLNTDLSRFVTLTTNVHRLNHQTGRAIKEDLRLLFKGKGKESHHAITTYAFFYLVSVALALVLLFAYVLPAMLYFLTLALRGLSGSGTSLADALLALSFFSLDLLLYGFALLHHHPLSHNTLFVHLSFVAITVAGFVAAAVGVTAFDVLGSGAFAIVLIALLGVAISLVLRSAAHAAYPFSRSAGLFESALLPVIAACVPLSVLFTTPAVDLTWVYAFSLGTGMLLALLFTVRRARSLRTA